MPPADDPSSRPEHALGLADNVRCILCGFQSLDRHVRVRSFCDIFPLTLRPAERITSSAFEIVTRLNKEHFAAIVRYGAFADLTVCITDFCKVSKYQKISLLAIAMLRGVIPVMLNTPECGLTASGPQNIGVEDPMIKYWFPVLFGFYDIIMNGEDLEVRRL
jgi:hypothetical protein